MQPSTARQTLEAARLFSAQAAAARDAGSTYRYNLEAALVFGRSVTFHLQKQFRGRPEFDDWYASWQNAMAADPVCAFFVEKRNFVLKEGRVNFNYTLFVEDAAVLSSFGHVELTVIRGGRWYRRPFSQLWEDALRPWMERRRRLQAEDAQKVRDSTRGEAHPATPSIAGFVDFRPSEPALKVLDEYFAFLDLVLGDAEAHFA